MAKDQKPSDSPQNVGDAEGSTQAGPATLAMPTGDPVVLERPQAPAQADQEDEAYDGKPVAVWSPTVPGVERRKVSFEDYERLGAAEFETLEFTPENDYTVLLEGVPNSVVDLLRKEPGMTIKGA